MQCNPCILGGPQEKGTNQNWPHHPCSQGPERGRNGYVTPSFLGVPRKGDKIRIGYITPTFSGARKWAQGLRNPCVLGAPLQKGTKLELATSPVPSRGPKKGRNCCTTPTFRGIRQKKGTNQNWLHHPYLLGARKWAELLRNPCVLGAPLQKGTKLELATSPVPSRGPKKGRNCCTTPTFRGIRQKKGTNQNWLHHPYLLGARKWAELLRNPYVLGGPQRRGQNQNWPHHPCLLVGSKVGGIARSPVRPRGSPGKGDKIRIGYITPTFSSARKWAELQCNPCVLKAPLEKGTKSELATSPVPSRGPESGRNCYVTPAFSVLPTTRNKIRIGHITHVFSWARKWAE